MTLAELPLLIEPEQLEPLLGEKGLLVIDLSSRRQYARAHIPGAVHLDYSLIVSGRQPVPGLLPPPMLLERVLGAIGLHPGLHVVALDDEGGGKAGRLLWTLDVIGHRGGWSLLNGGLHAWTNEEHRLEGRVVQPEPAHYPVAYGEACIADHGYLLGHLDDPEVMILDARTADEYHGRTVRAARGGHIPGAVSLDWMLTLDRERNLRLLDEASLRALLDERGLVPGREIICHCQTHHRSSHSYVMLRSLGYTKVRGYPGSWAEWGNDPHNPIDPI